MSPTQFFFLAKSPTQVHFEYITTNPLSRQIKNCNLQEGLVITTTILCLLIFLPKNPLPSLYHNNPTMLTNDEAEKEGFAFLLPSFAVSAKGPGIPNLTYTLSMYCILFEVFTI